MIYLKDKNIFDWIFKKYITNQSCLSSIILRIIMQMKRNKPKKISPYEIKSYKPKLCKATKFPLLNNRKTALNKNQNQNNRLSLLNLIIKSRRKLTYSLSLNHSNNQIKKLAMIPIQKMNTTIVKTLIKISQINKIN